MSLLEQYLGIKIVKKTNEENWKFGKKEECFLMDEGFSPALMSIFIFDTYEVNDRNIVLEATPEKFVAYVNDPKKSYVQIFRMDFPFATEKEFHSQYEEMLIQLKAFLKKDKRKQAVQQLFPL